MGAQRLETRRDEFGITERAEEGLEHVRQYGGDVPEGGGRSRRGGASRASGSWGRGSKAEGTGSGAWAVQLYGLNIITAELI